MIVKINGIELEGVDSFGQTKQANDIGDVSTRQSNFATMRIPKTAKNNRVFNLINGQGSQSNFPYIKNQAEVIDDETGLHLVLNGQPILRDVGDNYTVAIYDGFINFAKQIENKTLFEVGLPLLNHVKNVQSVIDSWNDADGFFRYLVADYNGKNFVNGTLNIDYQVPSAKVSYLWERIFEFAGWSYAGAIFDREDFQSLYLTYPKPAPTDEPIVIPLTSQTSVLQSSQTQTPDGNGIFFGSTTVPLFFPNGVPQVQTTGTHRIKIENMPFTFSNGTSSAFVRVQVTDYITPTFDEIVNFGTVNEFNVFAEQGQFIVLQLVSQEGFPLSGFSVPGAFLEIFGEVQTSIDLIDGFVLGFDEAFIDFKCTDFLREIMVRFGLTPIVNEFEKSITFLTLKEKLQTAKRYDWTSKFAGASKSFVFKNYAQQNDFKFRYNEENEKHENSKLSVPNLNLEEEKVSFQSSTYAPERNTLPLLGFNTRTYRIWNKELKDDGEIEYKDLEGRFYFVKAELSNLNINIESELLSQSGSNAKYYKSSYFRCSWNDILIDFYSDFRQIVTRAQSFNVSAWLTKLDIQSIKFDELVFFKQLGQYGFINKVGAYRKNQPTSLEVVGVDFFTNPEIIAPPNWLIQITNVNENACQIEIDFDTNLPTPLTATVKFFKLEFGFTGFEFIEQPQLAQENAGLSPFQIDANEIPNGFYKVQISTFADAFTNVQSNLSEQFELTCFAGQDATFIRIEGLKLQSSNTTGILKSYTYQATLTMDLLTPPLDFVIQFFVLGFWTSQPFTYNATPTDNGDGTMTLSFEFTINTFSPEPTAIRFVYGSIISPIFDL